MPTTQDRPTIEIERDEDGMPVRMKITPPPADDPPFAPPFDETDGFPDADG